MKGMSRLPTETGRAYLLPEQKHRTHRGEMGRNRRNIGDFRRYLMPLNMFFLLVGIIVHIREHSVTYHHSRHLKHC